jgi:hypothetical protein
MTTHRKGPKSAKGKPEELQFHALNVAAVHFLLGRSRFSVVTEWKSPVYIGQGWKFQSSKTNIT